MSTVEDLKHDRSGGRRYQRYQDPQRPAGVEIPVLNWLKPAPPRTPRHQGTKAACNGYAVQGSEGGISVAK